MRAHIIVVLASCSSQPQTEGKPAPSTPPIAVEIARRAIDREVRAGSPVVRDHVLETEDIIATAPDRIDVKPSRGAPAPCTIEPGGGLAPAERVVACNGSTMLVASRDHAMICTSDACDLSAPAEGAADLSSDGYFAMTVSGAVVTVERISRTKPPQKVSPFRLDDGERVLALVAWNDAPILLVGGKQFVRLVRPP